MIYKATITFEMFVEALDEKEAREIIEENADDELENTITSAYFDPEIEEVMDISQVPQEWLGAIPYGSYDDETIQSKLEAE